MDHIRRRYHCYNTQAIFRLTTMVGMVILFLLVYAITSCSRRKSIGVVYDLEEQGSDYLWVCGGNGIIRWRISDKSFTQFNTQCRDILVQDDNHIWVASERTVSHYDGDSWHTYTQKNSSLQGWDIASMLVDHDRNIWAGTMGGPSGLYRYDPVADSWQLVVKMGPPPSLPITGQVIREEELGGIYAILQSSDRAVWVGTSQGVLRLDDTRLSWTEADGLSNNSVRSLAESPDGAIWIGTGDGISRWDGKVWQAWLNPAGDPDPDGDVISKILATRSGVVWAVADESVLRWTGGSWHAYHLGRGNVYDIQETLYDEIWIATQKGVFRWNGHEWREYSLGEPEANDVQSLFEDSQGHLWAGTAGGNIYRYDSTTDLWYSFPSSK